MLYNVLIRMIERKNYATMDEIKEKLSILMLNGQITDEEYDNLMQMLEK